MQRSYLQEYGREISLLDTLEFLKKSWKIIAGFGVLGLIGAIGYILVTPPMYQATAQIRMAQVSQVNTSNPIGVNIEEASSLIARMQFPTNYSAATISSCGYQDKLQPALDLSKDIKFTAPKGMANTVEIKILSPSPKQAESCANSIFIQIALLQEQFSKVFVEEAKIKLSMDNERIEAARKLITKADQSGSAMSAAYLSARDELTYFLTDREKMVDLINSVKNRGSSLVAPIYVSEKPVSPKKTITLLAGLLSGLFLGVVIALGQQGFRKLKSEPRGML
jgi:capsular polysaccharide biosynthesis protein